MSALLGDLCLLDFIPRLSPEYTTPWHARDWCEQIEAALVGGVRALCAYPIRHGKTETTIHGIAWLLLRDPTMRILLMVADHEVAKDRGRRIRQVCEAAGIGPERGFNEILSWRNAEGGGVQVMSAKQSKLGQDVDVLIFDDPLSEQDAKEKKWRDEVDLAIAHYTARAGRRTRRGSVLGIMSRWHPDDPIGRRMNRRAETWSVFQARAVETDPETGERKAFAPEVMDLAELDRRRSELKEANPDERIWFAQFQNDPRPDVMGLFRNPRRYEDLPTRPGFRTVFGIDLAYSSSAHSDYFALCVLKIWPEMVVEDGRTTMREVAYVAAMWRERWDLANSVEIIRLARGMFPGATIYSYMSGPEKGSAQYLTERGIEVQVIPARYSKRQRAQRTIDLSNAGRILFPVHAPWVNGAVARLILFSGDETAGDDDEIDALVSGIDGGMGYGGTATPRTLGKRRI